MFKAVYAGDDQDKIGPCVCECACACDPYYGDHFMVTWLTQAGDYGCVDIRH